MNTQADTAASGPRQGLPSQSYVNHLREKLAQDPPGRKGVRTRERIKLAAAEVLEKRGYHGLRISDVAAAASVAEGSFYVYFKDKAEVSVAILNTLFDDFFKSRLQSVVRGSTPFASIRDTNRLWISLCRDNAGLIRAILQLCDENPQFAKTLHRVNHTWYEKIVRTLIRRYPTGALDPVGALLAVHMLGAMMDELARRLLIYPQKELLDLLEELGADHLGLADAASVMWMKCLYPGIPIEPPYSAAAERLINWPPGSEIQRDV